MTMKKLIALDGSTTKSGYAVFKIYKDNHFSMQSSGVIIPPKTKKAKATTKKEKKENRSLDMDFRMFYMRDIIFDICEHEHPDYIVVEDTYLGKDPSAYKWLCRLQGFLMGYSQVHNIDFDISQPSHWRSALSIPLKDGTRFYKRAELKALSKDYCENTLFIENTTEDESEAILIGWSKLIELGMIEK